MVHASLKLFSSFWYYLPLDEQHSIVSILHMSFHASISSSKIVIVYKSRKQHNQMLTCMKVCLAADNYLAYTILHCRHTHCQHLCQQHDVQHQVLHQTVSDLAVSTNCTAKL